MKFNQIWCVSYSHEWGVQLHFFLAPSPGAFGRCQKVKYHSIARVMPQGWDFGALPGCPGGQNYYFQTWSCGISNRRGWRAEQNASKIFILASNWWPWSEVKGQISLNFGYHVNFKGFYTKLCVCSHKWKIQNISDGIFILSPGSCPRGGTLGHWWCPGGQFIFQTWSCGISNWRGWRAEQNASNIFILWSTWWPWGEVKRSNIIYMSISKILIPNFVCALTNER